MALQGFDLQLTRYDERGVAMVEFAGTGTPMTPRKPCGRIGFSE
jgi:hypothetical protein